MHVYGLQVCPPGLHITLGIFYRLFKLLEEACHELDLTAKFSDSQAGSTYDRYITALRQQSSLKESEERLAMQHRGLEQLVTSLGIALPNAVSSLPSYRQLCTELAERKDRLKRVVNSVIYIYITLYPYAR